jgi:hypothetical protein
VEYISPHIFPESFVELASHRSSQDSTIRQASSVAVFFARSPGVESVRMALYVYGKTDNPVQNGAEVVIEKFEYLP